MLTRKEMFLPRQLEAVSCDCRNVAHIFRSWCSPKRLAPCRIPSTLSTLISMTLVYMNSINSPMAHDSSPCISICAFSDSNMPFVNIAQRYGLHPHSTTLWPVNSFPPTLSITSHSKLRSRNSCMTLNAFCVWPDTENVLDSIIFWTDVKVS